MVLCDTNGGLLPDYVHSVVKEVKEFMREEGLDVELDVHMHNDSGCALANTVEAADLGITQLHATVNINLLRGGIS